MSFRAIITENAKTIGDVAAGGTAFVTLADYLPAVAASCSILWFGIRTYEWARVRLFKQSPMKMLD